MTSYCTYSRRRSNSPVSFSTRHGFMQEHRLFLQVMCLANQHWFWDVWLVQFHTSAGVHHPEKSCYSVRMATRLPQMLSSVCWRGFKAHWIITKVLYFIAGIESLVIYWQYTASELPWGVLHPVYEFRCLGLRTSMQAICHGEMELLLWTFAWF